MQQLVILLNHQFLYLLFNITFIICASCGCPSHAFAGQQGTTSMQGAGTAQAAPPAVGRFDAIRQPGAREGNDGNGMAIAKKT
jgi:hypothetical protein